MEWFFCDLKPSAEIVQLRIFRSFSPCTRISVDTNGPVDTVVAQGRGISFGRYQNEGRQLPEYPSRCRYPTLEFRCRLSNISGDLKIRFRYHAATAVSSGADHIQMRPRIEPAGICHFQEPVFANPVVGDTSEYPPAVVDRMKPPDNCYQTHMCRTTHH